MGQPSYGYILWFVLLAPQIRPPHLRGISYEAVFLFFGGSCAARLLKNPSIIFARSPLNKQISDLCQANR